MYEHTITHKHHNERVMHKYQRNESPADLQRSSFQCISPFSLSLHLNHLILLSCLVSLSLAHSLSHLSPRSLVWDRFFTLQGFLFTKHLLMILIMMLMIAFFPQKESCLSFSSVSNTSSLLAVWDGAPSDWICLLHNCVPHFIALSGHFKACDFTNVYPPFFSLRR